MQGRIVGIGIGEDIEIAWGDIDERGNIADVYELDVLDPALNDRSLNTDAHEIVRNALRAAQADERYCRMFDGVIGGGFSAIGRVDRSARQLTAAIRKRWKIADRGNGPCTVDFAAIKDEFFPWVHAKNFQVNNDAPCAALAERDIIGDESALFYITINNGVNVGIVHQGFELDREDHPSFGHAYPRPHRLDRDFFSAAACPHGACFDALASGARIREGWKDHPDTPPSGELGDFPDGHPAWDIIAYYIAQLCVAGQTMFAPNCIVLGGSVLWGWNSIGPEDPRAKQVETQLMPRVWHHYVELRGWEYSISRSAGPRQADGIEQAASFIRRGSIFRMANGLGALALARVPHIPAMLADSRGGR